MGEYAFKLVCLDDTSPMEFAVLDDVNRGNLQEVFDYLNENISRYDIGKCKWILLPISRSH